jgi:hypothetical protein
VSAVSGSALTTTLKTLVEFGTAAVTAIELSLGIERPAEIVSAQPNPAPADAPTPPSAPSTPAPSTAANTKPDTAAH